MSGRQRSIARIVGAWYADLGGRAAWIGGLVGLDLSMQVSNALMSSWEGSVAAVLASFGHLKSGSSRGGVVGLDVLSGRVGRAFEVS